MNRPSSWEHVTDRVGSSIAFKLIVIGVVLLALQIPTLMIYSLNRERMETRREAVEEIFAQWSRAQQLSGPVLRIPYLNADRNRDYLAVLPDRLQIRGDLTPEIRYRGIHQAVLYRGDFTVSGDFDLPRDLIAALLPTHATLLPGEAELVFGLSDPKGLSKHHLTVNGENVVVRPGARLGSLFDSGFSIPVAADIVEGKKPLAFAFRLECNGSQRASFLPLGRVTEVELSSRWPDPGFFGAFTPQERKISADGFTARYTVNELNRDFPQSWTGDRSGVEKTEFGVNFFIPADIYLQTNRAVRYSALVILFAMLAFFFAERLTGCRVHPVQYLMAGAAVVLFYVLFLSLGEHLKLFTAYAVAAVAVSGLIGYYSLLIFRRRGPALIEFVAMLFAYAATYVMLQLVDYALLTGTAVLFVLLAVVMTFTGGLNRSRQAGPPMPDRAS